MFEEGQDKVSLHDLKPVRIKRVKPVYVTSKHKVRLGKKHSAKRIIEIGLLLIVLLILVFPRSNLYKILKIGYLVNDKNILVGFQNSAELRPTGGFWGSFGIWKIGQNISSSQLFFETNLYKNDNQLLLKSSEPLPEPMKEVFGDRSQSFVNANWSASFPQTAKSLEWFLSQGWNQSVDGTIAVSSLAVIDLLKLTGPLELEPGDVVTSDNFTQIMSEKIDTEYWQDKDNISLNEPKTILKELSPKLIEKAKSLGYFKLYKFLLTQMNHGRIIAFFSDKRIEGTIKELGISGEFEPYSIDYLEINNSNLGGHKSSLNVTQSIDYSLFESDTNPTAKLVISREMNNSWPKIQNRNYTRVFTPLGSKLLSAKIDNIDIKADTSQEDARTCFGFWFSVEPGQNRILTLEYSLPFENNLLNKYNLVYQKQPGTLADKLKISVMKNEIYNSIIDENIIKFKI